MRLFKQKTFLFVLLASFALLMNPACSSRSKQGSKVKKKATPTPNGDLGRQTGDPGGGLGGEPSTTPTPAGGTGGPTIPPRPGPGANTTPTPTPTAPGSRPPGVVAPPGRGGAGSGTSNVNIKVQFGDGAAAQPAVINWNGDADGDATGTFTINNRLR